MSQPNPELVEALNSAVYRIDNRTAIEDSLKSGILQIQDEIGRVVFGHTATAVLLIMSTSVRTQYISMHDLELFDAIIYRTRERMNSDLTKPNPAVTIVGVLQRNRDTQIIV
jgi:hypothetical protein